MKILTVYTLNSHLFTIKAHNHKTVFFLSPTKIFEASQTKSVDPYQSVPLGAVLSGLTMLASMLMLNRHFQMLLFCWRFKDKIMCFASILRLCRKMIQILLNKTTPHFQLLPMSKVDQS